MAYLLDTNVLSALLREKEKVWQTAQAMEWADQELFISTISYYEIKRGLLANQATKRMERFDHLRRKYTMLGTDNEAVLDEAAAIYAELKQRGELLPDADIFIAAVARVHGLILVTDDNHFNRISGLQLENWVRD
jgi:tRNA(fMet)-specific endonuclease VapC